MEAWTLYLSTSSRKKNYSVNPSRDKRMAGFHQVSQLKPYKLWRIKVKIVRLWKQYSAQGGETIELVLVDSNVSTNLV